MVAFERVVFGAVFAAVGLYGGVRLLAVARTYLAVRRAPPADPASVHDGDTCAVAGRVVVDDPAPAADRLFDADDVGAYLWRAQYEDAGRYTYDFDRGEHRQGRSTFAAGVNTGEFAVATDARDLAVDLSWLRDEYDSPTLDSLEIGNPKTNTSLPAVVTRRVWDSPYVDLSERPGDCTADRLTDVVDLYRSDVHTDEFVVDARGLAAGDDCYVRGEVTIEDGVPTLTGTDETPLLVADSGYRDYRRTLGVRALTYAGLVAGMAALLWLFVL
jgi:hypothetical protein